MLLVSMFVAGCSLVPGREPTGSPAYARVDAELIAFSISTRGLRSVSAILRTPQDAELFGGWFATRKSTVEKDLAQLSGRPRNGEVLIAFAYSSGCTTAKGAQLERRGADYSMRLTDTKTYQECYAPFDVLAVFAVPATEVPESTRLLGDIPDPAGPAELVAFVPIGSGRRPATVAAEISQPDQREQFLSQMPDHAGKITDAIEDSGQPRLFGFILSGCQNTGAVLHITTEQLRPELTGGQGVNCATAEYFVAVFSIKPELVPASARIGA